MGEYHNNNYFKGSCPTCGQEYYEIHKWPKKEEVMGRLVDEEGCPIFPEDDSTYQTKTESFQCVFVNTNQPASKINRMGFFKVERFGIEQKPVLFELCEIFYPHPNAPNHALVSVYRFLPVTVQSPALILSIEQAEKALKGFSSVTELE